MAIDTANKRRSVLALDGPVWGIGPVPDGNLASMADTRHLAGCYRFEDIAALTNTADKRRSVFGLDGPVYVIHFAPDGNVSAQDRRHLLGHYRLQNEALPVGWTLPDRDLAWSLADRDLAWSLSTR